LSLLLLFCLLLLRLRGLRGLRGLRVFVVQGRRWRLRTWTSRSPGFRTYP